MSLLTPEKEDYSNNLVEPRKRSFGSVMKFVRSGVIVLILVVGVVYGIKTKPELIGLSKNTNIQNENEIKDLVKKVGKIIQLPDGETPTAKTLADVDVDKAQPFFKNAKPGDKVLIYQEAKKAYLYRPSDNKIIEVGMVNNSGAQGQVAGQNKDIQVITPTPVSVVSLAPTASPIPTSTITPKPTFQVTKTPTLVPSPTVAP